MSRIDGGSGDSPTDCSMDVKGVEINETVDNKPSSNNSEKLKIMSSKFSDPKLDPAWLFTTLQREINKEATYNLENDAKLRAVSQGTVNYEQFRQMVLGANLCPLDRKDKIEGCQNGKKPYVVWNTVGAGVQQNGNGKNVNRGKCHDDDKNLEETK